MSTGDQDGRVQAMAAAMLPLLWPSFQLAGAPARSARSSPPMEATNQPANRPLMQMQLPRSTKLEEASHELRETSTTLAPTSTTTLPSTTTTTTSPNSQRAETSTGGNQTTPSPKVARKKRRKPVYLMADADLATGNKLISPYPADSTRLASKYALPRLKFSRSKSVVKQSPGKLSEGKLVEQLPLGLSKLIEQQIHLNASSLLRHNRTAGLAPTTSVSKTVRLKANNTGDIKITLAGSSSLDSLDLMRQLSNTTVAPVTSTTITSISNSSSDTTSTRALSTSQTKIGPTTERPLAPLATTMATKSDTVAQTMRSASTEPGDLYKSLPSPTTTDDHHIVSNKIPADDEESLKAAIKSGQSKRALDRPETSRKLAQTQQIGRSNIKLFHFKRKPDMNKLPFYKRPLNYTELGWTNEQIQEHLDSLAASGEQTNSSSSIREALLDPSESVLLKRKRRGKSQFERLIAELHGESSEQTGEEHEQEPDLVPALRKKTEPLLIKPMFSVMNQKRRVPVLESTSAEPSTSTSTSTSTSSSLSREIVVTPEPEYADREPDGSANATRNKSTPIIRLRRKHHGEQPLQSALGQPDQQPWRPSKPLVWSSINSQTAQAPSSDSRRLLLIPSGLLTPSGSHLVPFFAQQGAPSAVHNEHWSANNEGWSVPVGGTSSLIPDELGQSAAPAKAGDQDAPKPTVALSGSTSGELRVPKLLVKPMRPAKYSLNGYIPKPSLSQQQAGGGAHLDSSASGSAVTSGSLQPTRTNSALTKLRQTTGRPGSQIAAITSAKDLDSSTSNEIFSRRRGLQQHQRSAGIDRSEQAEHQPANLDAPAPRKAGPQLTNLLSPSLRQMEENKRKYIIKQPQKSPTLSVQKANMIKAKLGLSVVASSGAKPGFTQKLTGVQAASSNSDILTADPDPVIDHHSGDSSPAQRQNGGALIGAPLNSIPKTDFECTDKKGKFVSGLFADHKTGCQVWHLCSNNRKYSFLCPSGTIFNAKLRICDWRYNVKCENTPPF